MIIARTNPSNFFQDIKILQREYNPSLFSGLSIRVGGSEIIKIRFVNCGDKIYGINSLAGKEARFCTLEYLNLAKV
jgi:hypothetical protein